ncbi:MAG: glycosyltransferase family 4 protein [Bacteroidetes bacterium]|nr:glycosyltransferase family 4 protein [Bacteroidota bacterium]
MKILFITPYPQGEAPSQRFRFEQYFPELQKRGYTFHVSPFIDRKAWSHLYKKGHWYSKLTGILRGIIRRFRDLFSMGKVDFVFIHREAMPFGPAFFEWLITHVFKKKTIYDFDDAIWLPNASENNSQLTMLLKRFHNPRNICRWANKVSVGNNFLGDFARQYNTNVVYNPTTIDTDEHHNTTTDHSNHKFIIGWTGSHSTLPYLDILVPVIRELEQKFDFEFHVICDVTPKFQLKSLVFVKWSKQDEIDDLLNFNVGVMPMPDDPWTRGKCGFKALQYMALGVPAVVSNVGVNPMIVDHEVNGCVCNTIDDWKFYLSKLLSEPDYLRKLSNHSREKIVSGYSLQSNRKNFMSLFSD